jgi:hypothetical protein
MEICIRIVWVHPVVYWWNPMYQYNDCLTQLFTKYRYIWLWQSHVYSYLVKSCVRRWLYWYIGWRFALFMNCNYEQGYVVSVVTRTRAQRSGVWILARAINYGFLHNVRTGSGVPTFLFSVYQEFSPLRWSGWGMSLTTYMHLVPKGRMSSSILYTPCVPSWHI